jgi:hypothetical protein
MAVHPKSMSIEIWTKYESATISFLSLTQGYQGVTERVGGNYGVLGERGRARRNTPELEQKVHG